MYRYLFRGGGELVLSEKWIEKEIINLVVQL